jgi:uncharacterized protein (DUF111 family)
MKKNRPATMVSILCTDDRRAAISELLYRETSTLGLRIRDVERECLSREFVKIKTKYGEIDVKVARHNGLITNAMPEYEQVRRVALENKIPFQSVHNEVMAELARNTKASAA